MCENSRPPIPDFKNLNQNDDCFIFQGVTLGVFSIMYLILVILMFRSFLNEVYLIIFSYILLASFFGIEVSTSNNFVLV